MCRTLNTENNKEATTELSPNSHRITINIIQSVWNFQVGRRSVFFVFVLDFWLGRACSETS